MSVAALEALDVPTSSSSAPVRGLAFSALAAVLISALGAATGCSANEECRLSSDCPSPTSCVEGFCVAECREDRDCPSNQTCYEGSCQDGLTSSRLCSTSFECEVGETCSGGMCTAVRIVLPDAGVAIDSGTAPADAGIEQPDLGTPDTGPSLLPYGAVCAGGSECLSGYCLGVSGSSSGRCTDACSTDDDCYYPDTCLDIDGAGKLCGQNPSLSPTGAACPNGPETCATGLCVDSMDGSGPICTQQCSPLPACPAQMTCQPVPDGSGGSVPVCIAGTGGGFGETCTAAADCATSLCVGVGTTGVCTSLCSTVPCPIGWTCTLAEENGQSFRVCAPEGAVGGQFGDTCTGAASCSSGLCLNDARTGSAFCTERCTVHADCAAVSGLTCVTLSSGVSVCGPL